MSISELTNHKKGSNKKFSFRLKAEVLKTLLDSARDGIYVISQERFEYVNPAFSAITGFSEEEILSADVNFIFRQVHPDDRQFLMERKEARKEGKPLPSLYRLRFFTKEGRLKYLELSTSPLPGGRVVGICRDITELIEMKKQLRENESLYSQLIENAQTPIAIVQDEEIKFVNRAICSTFGYEKEEIVGTKFVNYLPESEVNKVLENYRRRMSGQRVASPYEIKIKHKNGSELFAEVEIGLIEYNERPAELAIIHDITKRKQTEEALKRALEKLRQAFGATINILSKLVEQKDPYTAGHHRRVSDLARSIAKELGLSSDRIDGLRFAASIHDIGKIIIPAEILSKPGQLNESELMLIKSHPQIGYELLKDVCFPWPIAEIIYQHHERMDGSGYPQGLKGEEIILEARILAVADVVEAMASHRPYRPAHPLDMALKEIEKKKGLLYDEKVVDACLRLFKEKGYRLK